MANETTVAANGAMTMTFYKMEARDFLRANTVLSKHGTRDKIDSNKGQTLDTWRPNVLSAVTTPFSEGIGPASATVLTGTTFQALLQQYGAYAKPTDMLELTGRDKKLANYQKIFRYQMALSADTLSYNELLNNAAQFYCGSQSATTWDGTKVLDGMEVRRLRRQLAAYNVPTHDDIRRYRLTVHPDVMFDLYNEDKAGGIMDLHRYVEGGPERLEASDVKNAWGFHIDESTVINYANGTINGQSAYQNVASGGGCLLNIDLSGAPLKLYYVAPDVVNQANPLGTTGVLGWKLTAAFKYIGSDGPRAYIANSAVSEKS